MVCDKCGKELESTALFCDACGEKIGEELNENVINEERETDDVASSHIDIKLKAGRFIRKVVIGIVLVIMSVFTLSNVYSFISGVFSGDGNIEEMPIVYMKNKTDIMMESKNKKNSYKLTDSDSSSYSSELIRFSNDNSVVFFADDFSGGEFKLYYRKTEYKQNKGKNADANGVKIANGVSDFEIPADGKFVVYQKANKLYYSNLKKDIIIDKDISDYQISKDMKKVLYRKSDGDLYICDAGLKPKPLKLDSGVSSIVDIDESAKEIYYIKSAKLYKKENNKEPQKISSGVAGARTVEDNIFFTKQNSNMKYDLYMLKGSEGKKIGKDFYNINFYNRILTQIDGNDIEYLILKSDGTIISAEQVGAKVGTMGVSEDEKYFYCIEDFESGKGVLNRYNIKKDSIDNKEKIADGVSGFKIEDDFVVVSANEYLAVYRNGKYTELSTTSSVYEYYDGVVFYYDNYNPEKLCGELVKYKNGKEEIVDTDVKEILVRSENDVYYIKDYNTESQTGILYRKNGNKPKKIDTDVNYIIK